MVSTVLLAQSMPSASSGVDWLYQFTNNLTNLTTQNGGALTQLGLTEMSCIALFTLISMVVNWQHHDDATVSPAPGTGRRSHQLLMRLIICCLLENYWVNPFPGAVRHQPLLLLHRPDDGRRLRSEFSRLSVATAQNCR